MDPVDSLNIDQAAARLKTASVPAPIVEVARRLQDASHAAVLVGGAVRDALLGIPHEDWDLATSATPSEVQALFKRTFPTGIEHGTVTVVVPPKTPVEVTTFRGEGEYVDGRRPSEVTFLRDLEQDLARRDFTVNAFAWDPIREVFSDPFGGLTDLRAGILRAVGDPAQRFAEDGLRTMRAVRFCATRELALDPATRDAIAPALVVLDKVSRERVLLELTKLLRAPRPSRGLHPMLDTGMWPHVLLHVDEAHARDAIVAIDDLPAEVGVRLARLLREAQPAELAPYLDRLHTSRDLRREVMALLGPQASALGAAADDAAIRQAAAALGPEHVTEATLVHDLDRARIEAACDGAPLRLRDLAVAGRDLIAAGLLEPGPAVGRTLAALHGWVLEDPTRNDRETLLARAAQRALEDSR